MSKKFIILPSGGASFAKVCDLHGKRQKDCVNGEKLSEHEIEMYEISGMKILNGPVACRSCGCTAGDCSGCVDRTGAPCHWVKIDLCSACLIQGVG